MSIKPHLPLFIALVCSSAYVACTPSSDGEGAQAGGASGTGSEGGRAGSEGGRAGSEGGAGGENVAGEGPGMGGDSSSGGVAGAGGSGSVTGGRTGGASGGASGGAPGGSAGSDAGGSDAMGGEGGGGAGDVGTVTFDIFAFYHPALISDADGVLHMVFNTNTSPSEMHYARCAADCGVGANWQVAVIGTHELTGAPRLTAGSDGRLHLLYDVVNRTGPDELIYATCASACIEPSNWTKTDLASLVAGTWNSPPGSSLVIDAQNRLSFTVDRKIYTDGGVVLATCAANCSLLSNWSAGKISAAGTFSAMAAQGTTLHYVVDNATGNGSGNALSYRTCSANCTQPVNWDELPNLFVYEYGKPIAMAVTAEGGVRVVYNQGQSEASQPAPVKAQDNKMLVWGCDADCLSAASWSGFVMGAAGDGADGLDMAELGGALVLSVSNGDRILTRYCGADCLVDSNWQEAEVDSVDALTSEYDPYTFTAASCSGGAPQTASWNLKEGVVAIRPDGSLAFAHTASTLHTCSGSTSVVYLPGFGRLVFAP